MISKKDIVVYIPTYFDHDGLTNSLEKCKELGLNVLVGIGRFIDFPDLGEDQKSIDICKNEKFVNWFGHDPCREEKKLNKAFYMANLLGYKVFMYHGSDAWLEGDIDRFIANLNEEWEALQDKESPRMFKIKVKEHQPKSKWNAEFQWVPRIYFNYDKMEARNLHWVLYEKGQQDDTKWLEDVRLGIISGLTIHHDNSIRTKERDDLMTQYQNQNVPRERRIWNEKCAERHFKDGIKVKYASMTDDYEKLRIDVLVNDYTHLVMVDPEYKLTEINKKSLEDTILKYNNINEHIQCLTGVHHLGQNTFRITEKIQEKQFPTQKLESLYKKANEIDEEEPIYVIPYVFGPILCLENEIVKLFSVIDNPEDFVWFCRDMSIPIYCDTRIQLDKK